MDMIPTINIDQGMITVIEPEQAEMVYQYYLRNKHHLAPWEPKRDDAFYSLAGCQDRVTHAFQQFQHGLMLPLGMTNPNRTELIACCTFSNIVRGVFQACYLGYSVDARYQGTGLMSKMLVHAIGYVFVHLDLHRIMANYLPDNVRSEALLKKLGFQQEGYAKSYLQINGQWQDHILTALINPQH